MQKIQGYKYEQAVGGRPPRYAPAPPLYAPHAAVQLQPIHALRMACGTQRALLPVAVGAMNIHDVRDRRQTDRRQTKASLNSPAY